MTTRLSRKPDDVLRRIGAGGTRATVSRILKTWDAATPSDIESGARWYGDDANQILAGLQHIGGISAEHAAIVVSHLSPRTTWSRNVSGAFALVTGGPDAALALGCTRANVSRAAASLQAEDPWSTFGPDANKTRRFARNLLGDRKSVTVDVWAARVALQDTVPDPEQAIGLVGVYGAIEHAYRLAAYRRGVDPTTMQATTWIVARNGRAA